MVKDKEKVVMWLNEIAGELDGSHEIFSEKAELPSLQAKFLSGKPYQSDRVWYLFPNGNVRVTLRIRERVKMEEGTFPLTTQFEERIISIYDCVNEFAKRPFGIDDLVRNVEDKYFPKIPLYH